MGDDGAGCMPCMPGRARPEDKSGSEEPDTSEAAVAAVATLSDDDISFFDPFTKDDGRTIPKQGAEDLDTRWGER